MVHKQFLKLKSLPLIKQKTPKWYETRHNMLTASNIASILEKNQYKTKVDLLRDKIEPYKIYSSNATEWGIKYEPIAIEIYEQFTKNKVYEFGLIQHPIYKWLGASPDGILENGVMVEIKCLYSTNIIEDSPICYWIQTQIQMEVCNLDYCDLFQCKFVEYSKDEYDSDEISIHKGIINNKYWKLVDYNCKRIQRDNKWFKRNINIINNFWNDVLYYRKNPLKLNRQKYSTDKPLKKRTRSNSIIYDSHTPNYIKDWNTWISATSIRNYMINDPLLDWFNMYGNKYNIAKDKYISRKYCFNTFLRNKGLEFENAIYKNLKKRFNSNELVKIADINDIYSTQKVNDTIKHIINKTPIIFQGVFHNENDNTYGIADLIVRTDYLYKIIENTKLPIDENANYVIIDIKYNTFNLKKDGLQIKNTAKVRSYKGQVILYNNALGYIQKHISQYCYLLGRRYKTNDKMIINPFQTLGVIDIQEEIYTINKINNAIQWIKNLKINGEHWNPMTSNLIEMKPNMSNKEDYPYHNIKKQIAHKKKEITLMWNIGIDKRNELCKKGITKWNELILNDNSKNTYLQQRILNINKSNNLYINKGNFKIDRYPIEFYVDFELTNNLNSSMSPIINYPDEEFKDDKGLLFMIGFGYVINNTWNYKCYIAKNKTEENQIITEWKTDMKNISGGTYVPVYHWSNAEPIQMKHFGYDSNDINWIDLMDILKTKGVVIKGVMGYGLKEIARQMYKYGMINTCWINEEVDGRSAMLLVWNNEPLDKVKIYNEIDCKVMWNILDYLYK